jgi:TolA-binding protein
MRQIILAMLLSSALLAQSGVSPHAAQPAKSALSGPGQATAQQSPAPQDDELARMRDDLNKLESLNQNMSSEIEFLNNQNLQILLRTNVQMWRIVIGDLRQQIEREERGRAAPPQSPAPASRPR